ncbi:glycoside hydrolase family 47 protein [Cylindrobasidium torrendii FP15055 ss-10]|uniref:alpha-1,2-Mannosidase n=1 Tax=Cylindrobasidium torrendii FP15055 ss-10 TaxID=1314674 RepID=A0A0D7BGF6_9AGAR|nr:glycoside hydrolase family 47 protein [Cylindrobasidium torrendii FP15055 ss-10]
MSEPTTRRRKTKASQPAAETKKQDESTAKQEVPETDDIDFSVVQRYIKLLWIPLMIWLGTFVYLNPDSVQDLASDWLGDTLFSSGYSAVDITADVEKRDAVVNAFKNAWGAYERDAMGCDEYHPISKKGSNLTEAGGIGYTVVDALDTIMMMGLKEEYARARKWVEEKLDFEKDGEFNTFETTIRVLGGLLSAYHLSGGDKLYLDRAVDVADRIMSTFDTPSGLPLPMVNLAKRVGIPDRDYPHLVSTAEVSTLQLELRYLSILTGEDSYWDKAENVMKLIKRSRTPHGLASIYLHVEGGQFVPSAIRLGSRGDSYYEYLLKQFIQTNQNEDVFRDMYDDSVQGIHDHLIQESEARKMIYTSELVPERNAQGQLLWKLVPKQDHLVCFIGGSLMLGATLTGAYEDHVSIPPKPKELTETGQRDWKTGVELIKTCMDTHDTQTGLSPEIVHFRIASDRQHLDKASSYAPIDWYIKGAGVGEFPPYDARYMLRPETVESLFIAYRLTGDRKYRNWGWSIFTAIEKHCKVASGGYATIVNVDEVPARLEDKMETFFLSETLKYLFLLFEDGDVFPLDKYVFNTEAHPFPIFESTRRARF